MSAAESTNKDESDSDLIGTYKQVEQNNHIDLLEAFFIEGISWAESTAISMAEIHFKLEKQGDYWKQTEYIRAPGYKDAWSIKYRIGKSFVWPARNGSRVHSIVIREGNCFKYKHEPEDKNYRTLAGDLVFHPKGMNHTATVLDEEENVIAEASYKYTKL